PYRCFYTRCFFFSSRRRHTRFSRDWSSDVCSSDLSTVDRDWSDWAIQPSFLPAMRQMTSYLARTLDERRAASVVLGERVDLAWSDEAPPTAILDPEGRELEHAVAEGGVELVAERPGIHRARVGD